MFLSQLSENEKNAFVSLSIHVSKANGAFAAEEKHVIREYCKEMGISFIGDDIKPMDEVVAIFKEADVRIKKIVLLEILGLVYSDGRFDDLEKNFINEYARNIGLTEAVLEKQVVAIKEYLEVLKKIGEVIE